MGRMPMRGMTGAAAMAHGAVAILRAAMTITTDDHTLTIDRCAAGTAGVREAAATRMAVTMAIASLTGGRSEDGKADRDGQEGDEFFHEGWRFGFDLLPHHGGVVIGRGAAAAIRDLSDNQSTKLHETKAVFLVEP